MANLFDYISWRGDIRFDCSPFNPVDNIIFSQVMYLPMDGIVPGPGKKGSIRIADMARRLSEKPHEDTAFPEEDQNIKDALAIVSAIGTMPRYMDCELFGYINRIDPSEEKQFSALSILIGKKPLAKTMLVVFRGTDMSLIGWKEDFNMIFANSIPSQAEAVAYLEKIAGQFSGQLMVAGHSKGGNLAVYASALCDESIQRRITAVYSNDAPGFHRNIIESEGYQAIRSRIQAFIPQSSLIGMLFEHGTEPVVVKSAANGILQHYLSSWEVACNGFSLAEELTPQSRLADTIIKNWIGEIEDGQRQQFIEAVYKILVSTNAHSVLDLTADWRKTARSIINTLKNLDSPTKKFVGKMIGDLFRTARKEIRKEIEKQQNGKKAATGRISRGGKGLLPATH